MTDIDVPPEVGALKQWRREVCRRERTLTTPDALRDAAIHEVNARDEIRQGLFSAARDSRLRAAALLLANAEVAA